MDGIGAKLERIDPSLRKHFAPRYVSKAKQEYLETAAKGAPLLLLDTLREQEWDNGVILAFVENVRVYVVEEEALSKKTLAAYMNWTPGAVDHLFRSGQVSAGKYERLRQHPELSALFPGNAEIMAHARREAITWIKRNIFHERDFRGLIGWDQLHFLVQGHRSDASDWEAVFAAQRPEDVERFSTPKIKWTPGRLLDTFNAWGKSFRLFVTDILIRQLEQERFE